MHLPICNDRYTSEKIDEGIAKLKAKAQERNKHDKLEGK